MIKCALQYGDTLKIKLEFENAGLWADGKTGEKEERKERTTNLCFEYSKSCDRTQSNTCHMASEMANHDVILIGFIRNGAQKFLYSLYTIELPTGRDGTVY